MRNGREGKLAPRTARLPAWPLCLVLVAAAPPPPEPPVVTRLERLHDEYRSLGPKPTVRQLVELDGKLRQLVAELPELRPERNGKGELVGDEPYWKDAYAELGLFVGKYTRQLGYSGVHLVRAHELDPRSPWRKRTLFATILGTGTVHGLDVMPDLEAALRYEREYPEGPFIAETYAILAGFYTDLYMVLRDEDPSTRRNEPVEYKMLCYRRYLTREPLAAQRKRAQERAVACYRKYLKLRPDDEEQRARMKETLEGTIDGWSFCAD